MRATAFDRFGGPDVLRTVDVPDPVASPGEVVVGVRAVGVNNIDLRLRAGTSGLPVRLPHVLGLEFAGEVVDVGPDADGVSVGDRVAPLFQVACRRCDNCAAGLPMRCPELKQYGIDRPGGYAEYVTAAACDLLPVPAAVPWPVAASVQTTYGTAWRCLVTHANVRPGETVLVTAAGSGVGSAAQQIAQSLGARVIATAGSVSKRARALELGATSVVDHGASDFTEQVLALTDGRGVDVAFTHVGGAMFAAEVATVAVGGRITVCGAHTGATGELDLQELFRTERVIHGSARATYDEIRAVFRLVAEGRLAPVIDGVLPLAEAERAHRALEDRAVFGKVVLQP